MHEQLCMAAADFKEQLTKVAIGCVPPTIHLFVYSKGLPYICFKIHAWADTALAVQIMPN